MLSNSSCTYLQLRWVNIYETIRRLYYAQVDGQSSQSSPTFYTPAFYPLSLPHPALPLFTHSPRHESRNGLYNQPIFFFLFR